MQFLDIGGRYVANFALKGSWWLACLTPGEGLPLSLDGSCGVADILHMFKGVRSTLRHPLERFTERKDRTCPGERTVVGGAFMPSITPQALCVCVFETVGILLKSLLKRIRIPFKTNIKKRIGFPLNKNLKNKFS